MVARPGSHSHSYQVPVRLYDKVCAGHSGVTEWDKKRNTESRAMAGLERVEVMLMRRMPRCMLGHVARMEETRIPKCLLRCKLDGGKHLVGGKKRWWNDVIVGYVKKCELHPNLCEEGSS